MIAVPKPGREYARISSVSRLIAPRPVPGLPAVE